MDDLVFWVLLLVVPLVLVAFDWEKARLNGTGGLLPASRLSRRPVLVRLALVVIGYALATGAHFEGVHLVRMNQLGHQPNLVLFWSLVVVMCLGLGLMGLGLLVRLENRTAPPA